MALTLIEAMPATGYSPVAAGVLDGETAWALVLEGRLGLGVSRPDAQALLEWLSSAGNAERFYRLPDDMKAGVRAWLGESAGPAGLAMLDATRLVSGSDVVALGVACGSLFDGSAGQPYPEARAAAIRLEPYTGGRSLSPRDAVAWADAAVSLVTHTNRDERQVRGWLDRADALLVELGAADAAWRSHVSPRGFEQRCESCALAIDAALSSTSGMSLAQASSALELVREHGLAKVDAHRDRVDRLGMALRLVRWLADRPVAGAAGFAATARHYLADGAFADRARVVLRGSDPSPTVAAVCSNVQTAATDRREALNARFAELFAGWLEAGSSSGVLTSERVLSDIVAPAAHAAPALLIVLDGMSASTFYELAESALEGGWLPVVGDERSMPEVVVTPLPSVLIT